MSVIDFNKRRFDAAKDATAITPADALREALRQVELGEIKAHSVVISILVEEGEDTYVEGFHGGPSTTLERIGILFRAQNMLLPGGVE